jgi:hypothetical protein
MKKGPVIAIIVVVLIILGFMMMGKKSAPDADVPVVAETETYTLTVRNVSDVQTLAPGVFALHSVPGVFDFEGMIAPEELKALAEVGDPSAFANFVLLQPGVEDIFVMNAPLMPGEETQISLTGTPGSYISGMMMAVGSNDGYALVNTISTESGIANTAINYDNGTEENTPLLSGFDGGQPDPARGAENLDNGTDTDPIAPVALHTQLTSPLMVVIVEAPVVEEEVVVE